MKLKYTLISQHFEGTECFIPVGEAEFSGVVLGNETLGMILKMLETDTSEECIIHALHERFNAPDGVIEADVEKVIKGLRKIGALDE